MTASEKKWRHPTKGSWVSYDEWRSAVEAGGVTVAEPDAGGPEALLTDPAPNLRPYMQPGPSPLTLLFGFVVVVAVALLVWDRFREHGGSRPAPQPAPVVVPSGEAARMAEPVAERLAYQPEKARAVWKAYSGLRDAIDGASGQRVADTRVLAAVTKALLEDVDAGGGEPVGRQIDEAVAGYLGIGWGADEDGTEGWEFKKFSDADRQKLVEILDAIATAAEGVL